MSHRLEMNTGLNAWLGTRRPMNEAGRGRGSVAGGRVTTCRLGKRVAPHWAA